MILICLTIQLNNFFIDQQALAEKDNDEDSRDKDDEDDEDEDSRDKDDEDDEDEDSRDKDDEDDEDE
ncbi:MAG TPA: hypothetical protein VFR65_06435, partial [Nitrososphaeraceae archaeon]|nr:hypothetical protein [Nitrososphaeraceae archaeon]